MREPEEKGLWDDLLPLLDQELNRLADKYRMPIVLCDLESKSRKEAALQLGWPEGTLSGRLARGRAQLAKRMSRYRTGLSAGGVAVLLSQGATSAGVPAALGATTARAASLLTTGEAGALGVISARVTALTEGVLKAMLLAKLKITTALFVLVCAVGLGAGGWAQGTQSPDQPGPRGELSWNDQRTPRSPLHGPLNSPRARARAEAAAAPRKASEPAASDPADAPKEERWLAAPGDMDHMEILHKHLRDLHAPFPHFLPFQPHLGHRHRDMREFHARFPHLHNVVRFDPVHSKHHHQPAKAGHEPVAIGHKSRTSQSGTSRARSGS